jgi:hypothetical protein
VGRWSQGRRQRRQLQTPAAVQLPELPDVSAAASIFVQSGDFGGGDPAELVTAHSGREAN